MIGDPAVLFGRSAQRLCREIADEIVAEVRLIAPRGKSGKLAEGYEAIEDGTGAAIVNRAATYWMHVEYGHNIVNARTGEVTGHVGQRPHVRPAIETVRRRRAG